MNLRAGPVLLSPLAAFGVAATAGLPCLVSAPAHAQQAAVAIDNDDIGGVVRGPKGPKPASG